MSAINESGHIEIATVEESAFLQGSSNDSAQSPEVKRVCVDYAPTGYFNKAGTLFNRIPYRFVKRPATVSTCELEALSAYCVDRINMYRTGALKFKNGQSDSNVLRGLSRVRELTGNHRCSTEMSLGDLVHGRPLGYKCAGAHYTAGSCGNGAQNSCCVFTKETTYSKIKGRLERCLQMMWDEGVTPGQKGHWQTMRNPQYTHVSCGFSWDEDGHLNINQDFYNSQTKQPCSCASKRPGDSDGCGGSCTGCANPATKACVDDDTGIAKQKGGCRNMKYFCDKQYGNPTYDKIRDQCPQTCGTCPEMEPTCPGGGGQVPSGGQVPAPAPTPSTTKCEDVGEELKKHWGQGYDCARVKQSGWCTYADWIPKDCPRACGKCKDTSKGGGQHTQAKTPAPPPAQTKPVQSQCEDIGEELKRRWPGYTCTQVKQNNWCSYNGEEWISKDCPRSCGKCNVQSQCGDIGEELKKRWPGYTCTQVKQNDWCNYNGEEWISKDCPRSCGKCNVQSQCDDMGEVLNNKWPGWTCEKVKQSGYCNYNGEEWISKDCPRSCGKCESFQVWGPAPAQEEMPDEVRLADVLEDIPQLTTVQSLVKALQAVTDRMTSLFG